MRGSAELLSIALPGLAGWRALAGWQLAARLTIDNAELQSVQVANRCKHTLGATHLYAPHAQQPVQLY